MHGMDKTWFGRLNCRGVSEMRNGLGGWSLDPAGHQGMDQWISISLLEEPLLITIGCHVDI